MRLKWRWKEYTRKNPSQKLGFYFIDNEELYFPKTSDPFIYASSRPREEVEKLLLNEIKLHEYFVFTSVKGDYSEAIYPLFQYVILIDVPKDTRIQCVINRYFEKFGNRMLVGGDLYAQEETFFNFVKSRKENEVEGWVQCLNCPIIKVDGTKPIEGNTAFILVQLQGAFSITRMD